MWKDKNFILLLTASIVIIGILVVSTNSNKTVKSRISQQSLNNLIRGQDVNKPIVTTNALPKDDKKVSVIIQKSTEESEKDDTVTTSVYIEQTKEMPTQSVGGMIDNEEGVTSFTIYLDPERMTTFSALSFRLMYNNNNVNLLPEDISLTVNPILLQENWLTPVKNVYTSDGKLIVDLALVNVGTAGFSTGSQFELLEIKTNGKEVKLSDFSFDSTETKIITKDGKELNLTFSIN